MTDTFDDMLALLKRYRSETPLGHQPHMIAHKADEIIAQAELQRREAVPVDVAELVERLTKAKRACGLANYDGTPENIVERPQILKEAELAMGQAIAALERQKPAEQPEPECPDCNGTGKVMLGEADGHHEYISCIRCDERLRDLFEKAAGIKYQRARNGTFYHLNIEADYRMWERGYRCALRPPRPLDMVLHCPRCRTQHIDKPDPTTGWANRPHKSHLCLKCRLTWRPADVATNGVEHVTRGKNDTWPLNEIAEWDGRGEA